MSVRKYTARPVEVEAIQLTRANWPAIQEWALTFDVTFEEMSTAEQFAVWVPTDYGSVLTWTGWWIVRKGDDLDVMDNSEFTATYQEAGHA